MSLEKKVVVAFCNTFTGEPIKVLESLSKLIFYLKSYTLVTGSVHQHNPKMLIQEVKGIK